MSALDLFSRQTGAVLLPDNKQWTNRVQIKSESSNNLYVIAKRKSSGELGCSCPGWIRHRNCKHLRTFAPVLSGV
jgi:hypothetical protein